MSHVITCPNCKTQNGNEYEDNTIYMVCKKCKNVLIEKEQDVEYTKSLVVIDAWKENGIMYVEVVDEFGKTFLYQKRID